MSKIKSIKEAISVLNKYGYDTSVFTTESLVNEAQEKLDAILPDIEIPNSFDDEARALICQLNRNRQSRRKALESELSTAKSDLTIAKAKANKQSLSK